MKKLIIFTAGAVLAGSALAQDNIHAPLVRRHALPPVNAATQSEGALQRGVRMGSPLQMFNPFAPREYGDGSEFVTERGDAEGLRPRDRPRVVGLRLFSIAF